MTIIDCPTPVCILQERAYTNGWRDYGALWYDMGGTIPEATRFYDMGWNAHERRDQRQAMYARKENTNERRPS